MSFLVPQDSFGLSKGCNFTESILLTGHIAGMGGSLLQYPLTEKGLTELIAPAVAVPAEFPAPWDKAVNVKFYVSDILLFLRDILASNDTD